jgi:hypothetical protein
MSNVLFAAVYLASAPRNNDYGLVYAADNKTGCHRQCSKWKFRSAGNFLKAKQGNTVRKMETING